MAVVKSTFTEPKIPDLSFVEFIFDNVQEYMDQPCETEYETGRTQTYRQVVHQCFRIAAYLQKENIQMEDKVAFYCDNVLEYVPSVLGTALVGGVVTFIRQDNIDNEEYRTFMGMPKFVFASPRQVESLQKAGYKNIIVYGEVDGCVPYSKVLDTDVSSFQKPLIKPSTLTAITLTGGTTGLPKGIEYTNRNMVAHLVLAMRYRISLGYSIELGETASLLCNFPANHTSGLIFRTGALVSGCHTILCKSFDSMTACKAIEKYKVTQLQLVPSYLFKILKIPERERPDISSVKDVTFVGGYVIPEIQESIKRTLKLRGLFHRFAMSECMATVFETSDVPRSVGKLMPGTQVKVVDVQTGELLGSHKAGEMYVSGPCVFRGYHNNPEKTASAFDEEGFFKTADIVYYDEDRNFYYVDRMTEIIKHKYGFIGGNELESLLCYHPSVQEAYCIAVPADYDYEVPRAYIILNKSQPPVTEDDLMQFVKDKVEPYKQIQGGIEFVEDVPRTVIGKAVKIELQKMYLKQVEKK